MRDYIMGSKVFRDRRMLFDQTNITTVMAYCSALRRGDAVWDFARSGSTFFQMFFK